MNLQNLKKLIYGKMKNDSALIALLGGNVNIFHFYPKQESNIPYPIVVYNLSGIEGNVYDSDRDGGINTVDLSIDVFSASPEMKEADDIADRIYALFHNQNLSNNDILVYTCFRNSQEEIYEETGQVWRIMARYELTNVAK